MLFFFGIFVCNDIQSNKMLILSILLYSITRCVYNTNDVTICIGRVGRWLLMMAKVMGIVLCWIEIFIVWNYFLIFNKIQIIVFKH